MPGESEKPLKCMAKGTEIANHLRYAIHNMDDATLRMRMESGLNTIGTVVEEIESAFAITTCGSRPSYDVRNDGTIQVLKDQTTDEMDRSEQLMKEAASDCGIPATVLQRFGQVKRDVEADMKKNDFSSAAARLGRFANSLNAPTRPYPPST